MNFAKWTSLVMTFPCYILRIEDAYDCVEVFQVETFRPIITAFRA